MVLDRWWLCFTWLTWHFIEKIQYSLFCGLLAVGSDFVEL